MKNKKTRRQIPKLKRRMACPVQHQSRPILMGPRRLHQRTLKQASRQRWTGVRIAQTIGLSRATVSRVLTRLKLNTAASLEPTVPIVRYEHPAPGDLLHLDIKKLARIRKPGHRLTGNPQDETRGAGWEFLYVAVDDHSRIAFTAMLPDEKGFSASRFLRQAVAYFAHLGITVRRVLTDNGPVSVLAASPPPAAASISDLSAPASTRHAPMAKPNASSKPPSANGPTPSSTKIPPTDSPTSLPGSTATSGIARMPVSISRRPFPGPVSMLTTS
jgi:hypothetical protein